MATPAAVVTAVFEVVKLPEAPEPGGVKVTVTPETALPYWSVTVAPRGLVKAVPTVALWLVPEVAVTVWAAPARLVSGNEAEVAPGAVVGPFGSGAGGGGDGGV